MVKAFGAFFVCCLINLSCIAGERPADCEVGSAFDKNLSELTSVVEKAEECPAPTANQIAKVCNSIYGQKPPGKESGLGYQYQEELWDMSCATPNKDTIEEANEKIRKMWDKNKENFKCENFSGVTVPNGNVLKFSMDAGFSSFLVYAVRKYKLDMNFKDPIDGKTIMDFLLENKIAYQAGGYTSKADEFEKIYNLLEKYGAKHAKDL